MEKQIGVFFRELPAGARRQDCEAFRSGAANDEFDGLRPIQRLKMAVRQVGWQRGNMLSSLGDGSFLFFRITANWVVPRDTERLVPSGQLLRIYFSGK